MFGGISTLVFTSLIQCLAVAEAPALYLCFCAALTLIAVGSNMKIQALTSLPPEGAELDNWSCRISVDFHAHF